MDAALTLFFNGSSNLYLDSLAFLATQVMTWAPLYIAIFYVLVREHTFKSLIYIILGLVISIVFADQVASGIVKPLVCRWRPTHEPSLMHMVDIVNGYRGGRYGFFSSHASNTCAIAVYLTLLFRHRTTAITLFSWCLLNCWTRLYLGVHYVGDITVGLIFGALVGSLIYKAMSQLQSRSKDMEPLSCMHYSTTRLNVITTVFLLTMVFISIPWKVYF